MIYAEKSIEHIQATENFKEFYENLKSKDLRIFGLSDKNIAEIMQNYEDFDEHSADVALSQRKVTIITVHDPEYPENLRHLHTPPFMLYVR